MPSSAPPVYRTGLVVECQVATVLVRQGCRVSLLKHGSDTAPALLAWRGKVLLPHWQVRWPDGHRTWLAVKRKTTCGVMRVLGNLRTTGIDRQDERAYLEVERLTAHAVKLVFVHQAEGVVVVGGLHEHRVKPLGAGSPMVWWSLDALPRLCSFADVQAAVPREVRLDAPLFMPPDLPPMQVDLFDGLA